MRGFDGLKGEYDRVGGQWAGMSVGWKAKWTASRLARKDEDEEKREQVGSAVGRGLAALKV